MSGSKNIFPILHRLVQCDEIPSIYGRSATNPYTRTLQREES